MSPPVMLLQNDDDDSDDTDKSELPPFSDNVLKTSSDSNKKLSVSGTSV